MTDPLPSARPSVLLLDDDHFTLSMLADMLESAGHADVRCESDARQALHSLAANPPGLLICDLSMPEMDGIEFLQAAASAGYRGHVMLLTGMESGVRRAAERLARAQGLQLLGAFAKPLTPAQLGAALALLPPPLADATGNLYNATTLSGK
ncbi:response regulator [Massilia sp. CF038]|uniref:response regulator n=1 Tax=Massilia sp. CF038 TaxID=1881045 RepID=UPI0009248783|nr:response regulator [Massilia sp. CF038]SHH51316.1 two-component system, chemotaxis family, response regulator CheY [Massilia sp. CF038]